MPLLPGDTSHSELYVRFSPHTRPSQYLLSALFGRFGLHAPLSVWACAGDSNGVAVPNSISSNCHGIHLYGVAQPCPH
jgi:hypothetical protein